MLIISTMITGRNIKVLNRRGISRAVVLLTIVALALIIAIAVPVAHSKKEEMARSVDDLYVKAAEDEAYLRWVQDGQPFSAVYDSENKNFIDVASGMRKANPYGELKEHAGMVLFVKVDNEGNISTKWVDQKKDTLYK